MLKGTQSKQYPIPDEGQHSLIIIAVKDKLQVPTKYGPKDKVSLWYAVDGTDTGEGEPMRVFEEFYASLGKATKPSRLAQRIEKIIGRKITSAEYESGFDEQGLVGKTVLAELVHNTGPTGTVYANIDEIYKNRNGGSVTPPKAEAVDDDAVPF